MTLFNQRSSTKLLSKRSRNRKYGTWSNYQRWFRNLEHFYLLRRNEIFERVVKTFETANQLIVLEHCISIESIMGIAWWRRYALLGSQPNDFSTWRTFIVFSSCNAEKSVYTARIHIQQRQTSCPYLPPPPTIPPPLFFFFFSLSCRLHKAIDGKAGSTWNYHQLSICV